MATARLFREKECTLTKAIDTLEQLTFIGGKEEEAVNATEEKRGQHTCKSTEKKSRKMTAETNKPPTQAWR